MKVLEPIGASRQTKIKTRTSSACRNLEKLKIAVHYGADAVFLGGQEYGLRSNADNFTMEEIKRRRPVCSKIWRNHLQQIFLHMMKIFLG